MDFKLGKLHLVNVRDIWRLEDTHFSAWLGENIELLGEALGLRLETVTMEQPVGDFSADIFAREIGSGRKVIIENQLARTDHDHLGKLLTYAAGTGASIVIWVSPEFRDEHRAALDWLNNSTPDELEFFGVQVEAVRVDDSKPAVSFNVVASPNDWVKDVRSRATPDDSARAVFFRNFFTALGNDMAAAGVPQRYRPSGNSWLVVDSWQGGIYVSVSFSRSKLQVSLTIETADADQNVAIFEGLHADAATLEQAMGIKFTWDLVRGRRRQSIYATRDEVDRNDAASLAAARRWAIDATLKFKRVFQPAISREVAALESHPAQ